jgi:phosphoglycolate phosphatase
MMTKSTILFADKAPKLIMLDLDGTLVDSVPDLTVAVDQMLSAVGKPTAGDAKIRTWVGNGAHALVARALSDAMDYPKDLQESVEYQQAYQLFLDYYEASNGVTACTYPGVKEALARWRQKGIKLAVVTNKPMQFTTPLIEGVGIAHFFDFVSGGDSLTKRKPEPDQLLDIMAKAGASAEDSLMVGDSSNDIDAAHAAGVSALAVPYGYNHGRPVEECNPDQVVDSLDRFHH